MAKGAGREAGGPLTPGEVLAALAPLRSRGPAGLLLAVSGGPDSIAMMRLLALPAVRAALPPLAVATVDHGLRPGSDDEAAFVLREAAAAGLPAARLAWTGPRPARAIQEKARVARYRLLAAQALGQGADHLLTAHTADDQAETVLFRLARGSGPAGLIGMRAFAALAPGLTQARPFLGFAKARLVATCAAQGWPFRQDPSNADPRFARVRMRRLLPALAAEGLDAAAFARLAARLARLDEVAAAAAGDLRAAVLRPDGTGGWHLDLRRLAAEPAELTMRLLGGVLAGDEPGRPVRLDRLEAAAAALRAAAGEGGRLTRTLHGHLLTLRADGVLALRAEPPRRRGRVAGGGIACTVRRC